MIIPEVIITLPTHSQHIPTNTPGGATLIDPKLRNSIEFPKWLNDPATQAQLNGKKVLIKCFNMLYPLSARYLSGFYLISTRFLPAFCPLSVHLLPSPYPLPIRFLSAFYSFLYKCFMILSALRPLSIRYLSSFCLYSERYQLHHI
jgi:hypothetical protein